ncbi:hypothetical protein BDK51DRAFT_40011 [Blyttiomyces helicus]|uniref:Uncharacterized protein n=1 Tax=Blyttiomyces helicus TaxID=388810 RepID=A0A4P9WDV8_9FUNG|nr:hypothetical protein BDK51DRAFT_40011 [Blyttiomyces helicus]|eukprot:RKO89863.1 hypothetical protein BDK51DRAFT_40011 [Blyttiomyces helicus]
MSSSTRRTREDRLRELELARSLFTRSRALSGSHHLSTSPSAAVRGWDPTEDDDHDDGTCFATPAGGIRGRVRVKRDGRHAFNGEEGGREWERERVETRVRVGARAADGGGHGEEKRGKVGRGTTVVDRATRAKRAASADAWHRLVSEEKRSKEKYYGTDKTLLVLLEEERARYLKLDKEYQKLMIDVQALQSNHLQDLRNSERRFETEQRSLEKAVAARTTEIATVRRELHAWQQRYSKESTEWMVANERLAVQAERARRVQEVVEERCGELERAVAELTAARDTLSERVAARDAELRRTGLAVNEKETGWMREKEARMKLEVQALQLDHFVAQRDEEIKGLRAAEAREKEATAAARREVEEGAKREKQLLGEIEAAGARERGITEELERLRGRVAAQGEDLESAKTRESALRRELSDVQSSAAAAHTRAAEQLTQTQTRAAEQLAQAQERAGLLSAQKEAQAAELQARGREIADLHGQTTDLASRLEAALQDRAEAKRHHKEKLIDVADRIADLQGTLSDTQAQLAEVGRTEGVLRAAIRQRDDTAAAQESRIAELELALRQHENEGEALRARKREEMTAVQEKFGNARAAMEAEVTQLRSQLMHRSAQLAAQAEDVARMKLELTGAPLPPLLECDVN